MKTFNQEDLLDFQEISQDQNPIHHHGIVFGMQLLAYLEGELEKQLHFQQLLHIDYCFYQPLYIGEEFELKVEEYHFQVFVKGKLIGEGEVHGK